MRFKSNPNESDEEAIGDVCLIQMAQFCADVQDDRDLCGT